MKKFLAFASLIVAGMLAAGSGFAQEGHAIAILKICKVAGPGVPVGTPFTFKVMPGSLSVTVPAGPPSAGTCWIAGGFPLNSTVTVTEITGGDVVTNITLAGGGVLTASPPNPVATVANMGAGMSVLTYTNERRKVGYLEICKLSGTPGNFTFSTNPSLSGPVTLQAMTCSPPIQSPSGNVVVTENAPGFVWTQCVKYIAGVAVPPCTVTGNTTTVPVVPGGVQGETLLFAVNTKQGGGRDNPTSDEMQQMLKGLQMTPSQ